MKTGDKVRIVMGKFLSIVEADTEFVVTSEADRFDYVITNPSYGSILVYDHEIELISDIEVHIPRYRSFVVTNGLVDGFKKITDDHYSASAIGCTDVPQALNKLGITIDAYTYIDGKIVYLTRNFNTMIV